MEAGAAVTAAVPLEVGDDPCQVVLSATGLLARIPLPSQNPDVERSPVPPPSSASSGPGDIVAAAVTTTARGSIGAVTSAGRMIRVSVIEIPPAPSGEAVSLAGGHPVDEFVPGLDEGETVLALAPLDGAESSGVAVGTASGIVKRVLPEYPANRDEFELITLKDGDRVIGAVHLSGDTALLETTELVFIASDAQLLRFPASAVRPQGRQAGGMAGIRLSEGATAIWFGALGPAADPSAEAVVVTVAGRSGALPGTGGASVKVTPFAEYPPKGRATGGVRCQRFLKGEDGLIQAWIGPPPILAATESGVMVDLSDMQGRRDGSGTALTRQLAYLGPAYRTP
jgi:DNA gyrase subunit A